MPNGSGSSGLRGRLLEGRLRYLPHRIHSLFTISNTRVPSHKELDTRVSCTRRGSREPHPQISLTFRTAQNRQAPWWSQTGSNRRPHACKARALPTELWPLWVAAARVMKMVGLGRLERPTSPLSGVRSNHLSYRPDPQEHKRSQGPGPRAQARHPITHCPDEKRETKTAASRIVGL